MREVEWELTEVSHVSLIVSWTEAYYHHVQKTERRGVLPACLLFVLFTCHTLKVDD